jgi:glucose/arabinose dehydrogenase
VAALAVAALALSVLSDAHGADRAVPALPALTLPAGFDATVFATALGAPRFMAVDPAGTLLVTVPSRGQVVALPDRDGDGKADAVIAVARGLDRPHGLAFRAGQLYVGETGRVVRLRYDPAILQASDPVVVVPDLPHGGYHWTRTIAFGPDGGLYVAVGSSCDVCREQDRRRATIVRYHVDGTGERLFATGLRSVVGLAFEPGTGVLWATVNERDWRGGGAPPDYVTAVADGAFYGWPGCFVLARRRRPDPEFQTGVGCTGVTRPTLEIAPHSAPLGLTFYRGQVFPAAYRGSLFVAYHGSRAELPPAGYKVVRVVVRRERPVAIEDFITGWRRGSHVVGRPVDVLEGADGALYITDDHAGRVYRVSFRGTRPPSGKRVQ